jgi:hypothetical protein
MGIVLKTDMHAVQNSLRQCASRARSSIARRLSDIVVGANAPSPGLEFQAYGAGQQPSLTGGLDDVAAMNLCTCTDGGSTSLTSAFAKSLYPLLKVVSCSGWHFTHHKT